MMTDNSWWVELSELDDNQEDIISLPPDDTYLVVGPPGSGKTNLLLLRASYLVNAQRPNVVVLVFTRTLRNFIIRGAEHYSVSKAKIQTIMHWELALLAEHGIHVDREAKPFVQLRVELAQRILALFKQKPALRAHLDCILVDEVQDCMKEEVEVFLMSAKTAFFVGDDRQQIYEEHGTLDVLTEKARRHELSKHYRNGEEICKVADAIGKTFGSSPLIESCNYDETKAKSSAAFESCKDENDMYDRLAKKLLQQLKAYPDELLGVACPTNSDVDNVRTALSRRPDIAPFLGDLDKMHDSEDIERRICICTIHDAKGLEFRAMHIPFAEHVNKMRAKQKKLAFTGATRAKTSLSIYHLSPLPGYLEQARETVSPRKPPPNVGDLFPRRK